MSMPLRDGGYNAADVSVVEEGLLKLSEILKKEKAAAHLGVVEEDTPKLSEVSKKGQASAHLGVLEAEGLKAE